MPKFVPEQFALVVRYVPLELSAEQVSKEVKRSANTARNFRAIVYSYPRSINDFRFTVSDLREYNGLLRLGHIGVGNRMHPITVYKPANKLTFCTKCWVLGHTRNKCPNAVQKCRICLLNYDEKHNNVCSKQFQCAQCHQDHYSLDANCKLIQQYRSNLNKAVRQATEDGTIKLPQTEVRQPTSRYAPVPVMTGELGTTLLKKSVDWETQTSPETLSETFFGFRKGFRPYKKFTKKPVWFPRSRKPLGF
jgi:hypothetical protein